MARALFTKTLRCAAMLMVNRDNWILIKKYLKYRFEKVPTGELDKTEDLISLLEQLLANLKTKKGS